jgi:hypothetical protein
VENAEKSIRAKCDSNSKAINGKDARPSCDGMRSFASRGIIQNRDKEFTGEKRKEGDNKSENESEATLNKTPSKQMEFRTKAIPRNSTSEIPDPLLENM